MSLLTVYVQNKLDDPIKFQVNSTDYLIHLCKEYNGNSSGLFTYDIFIPYMYGTFSDYGIPNGAIFHYFPDGTNIVFLCLNNGQKSYIPVKFNPKTLVRDFKKMLHDEFNIQFGQQKLFYHNQELQDDNELQDYMITVGSIIYLTPFLVNKKSNTSENTSEQIQIQIKTYMCDLVKYQIEAKPSTKIMEIKKKIMEKDKYLRRIEVIILLFNKDELDDYKTLQDYSITNNSTLFLIKKEIYKTLFLSVPGYGTIKFDGIDTDKIIDVKTEIQRETGISYINQKLFCNGIELIDNKQIQNYSEIECYHIDLVFHRNGWKTILIKRNIEHIIPIELKPNGKIIDIKKELPYPLDESIIEYNGKVLENDEEVAYNPDFSDLDKCMTLSMSDEFQLFVKLNCNHMTFQISPYDFIRDIKYLIKKREGIQIDQQRLLYAGKQIEDYETVRDCKIEKNSTLHLLLRLRGG